MGATGTVTEVDGDQVYAFGHPFYNLGPTAVPDDAGLRLHAPAEPVGLDEDRDDGETIGTFRQDRATAIAGTLGKGPDAHPGHDLARHRARAQEDFKFQVVNDQLFTPLLTYVSILNTLTSYEREYRRGHLRGQGQGRRAQARRGRVRGRVHGRVALDRRGRLRRRAAHVPAGQRHRAGARSTGVDLAITTSEQPRTATLERVWLDAVKVKPGTTVPLKLLLRTYRGEEITRTVPIDIPANASGTLSLLVSDGTSLARSRAARRADDHAGARRRADDSGAEPRAGRTTASTSACSARTRAASSTARSCRRCRRRCWP